MDENQDLGNLRARAEAHLKNFPELGENPTPDEIKALLHELRVYQMELEMQNEELRVAQQQLEESRDQYSDLFEFAPVGYFILDRSGLVINSNLTACRLLGIERKRLSNRPFSVFIAGGVLEQNRFRSLLKKVFDSETLQSCELQLIRKNNPTFTSHLDISVTRNEKLDTTQCRMTMTDITGKKQTERLLTLTQQLQVEKEKLRQSEATTAKTVLQIQEKERSRIAAELHDGVNSLLSMASLNVDVLLSRHSAEEDPDREHLIHITSLLDNALKGIKEIFANLSPALLKDFGLQKALKNLCDRFEKTGLIKIEYLSHGMEERIEPMMELNLYRIAQELLNNTIKHAKAKEAEVQLIRHRNSVILMVRDDGVGFDQPMEVLKNNGFGFKNIASRLKLLDGYLDIDSAPGQGTTTTIELPI